MVDYDNLIQSAKQCGFTEAAPLDVTTLEFLSEVRDMCAACPQYGTRWVCPPACGSLDDMRQKVGKYSRGLLVQTVGQLEDSYDWENMQQAMMRQGESYHRLWDALLPDYPGLLAMGTGECKNCDACTYLENKPCRFPDKQIASMESCGLLVSKVCSDNHLPYYYGSNTIAFTACFLLE